MLLKSVSFYYLELAVAYHRFSLSGYSFPALLFHKNPLLVQYTNLKP